MSASESGQTFNRQLAIILRLKASVTLQMSLWTLASRHNNKLTVPTLYKRYKKYYMSSLIHDRVANELKQTNSTVTVGMSHMSTISERHLWFQQISVDVILIV